MFKKVFIYIGLLLCGIGYAQKESNIWYFGNHAGIDFNSGSAVVLTDSAMDAYEGCATISNAEGEVLFYTNGLTAYNRNHEIMVNGEDLNGHESSTQSAIIVPHPGKSNRYYIFTVDYSGKGNGLQYSVVDMDLDGGMGAITEEKNITLTTPVTEKITAIKHADGESIWVLAHENDSDVFLAYLVTASGIGKTPIRSQAGIDLGSIDPVLRFKAQGYMKVSPDGSKVGVCHFEVGAEILDFDNATGELSNAKTIGNIPGTHYYGLEFSPNGKLLYLTVENYFIYQYDLTVPDIQGSQLLVMEDTEFIKYYYGALQLAPDGKIYFSRIYQDYLGVIENPNVRGMGCNAIREGLYLEGKRTNMGLPTFIQSYFYTDFSVENFCLGETTRFSLQNEDQVKEVQWDFGDGHTSTELHAENKYELPGTYTVVVTITAITGEKEVKTKEITINKVAVAHKPDDILLCTDKPEELMDLNLLDATILKDQKAEDYSVTYYEKERDAQLSINALDTQYVHKTPSNTIYARVDTKGGQDCYDITNFQIAMSIMPEKQEISDWVVCDDDMDGIYDFDLQLKSEEILGAVADTSMYELVYYPSLADATDGTNAVPSLRYRNSLPKETIFYKLSSINNPSCNTIGNFTLEVISQPIAYDPGLIRFCDDDNDGLVSIQLKELDEKILKEQNPGNYEVSYYESLTMAEDKLAPLNKEEYVNTRSDQQRIYARVDIVPQSMCFDIVSVDLNVDRAPIRTEVSDWVVCKDPNAPLVDFDLKEMDPFILGPQSADDYQIRYYHTEEEANIGTNNISGPYTLEDGFKEVFYRLQNANNPQCYIIGAFLIGASDRPIIETPSDETFCYNGTGEYLLDFHLKEAEILRGHDSQNYIAYFYETLEDAQSGSDPLPMAYSYKGAEKTIYVRVESMANPKCFELTEFNVHIKEEMEIPVASDNVICPENPTTRLDGGVFDSWYWRDGTGRLLSTDRFFEVSEVGTYSLQVVDSSGGIDCSLEKRFTVNYPAAMGAVTYNIEHFSEVNRVEVEIEGPSIYQYSLDGYTYQDSNVFMIPAGRYKLFIKGENDCVLREKEMIILGYDKFFTPNSDGINDGWGIKDLDAFPGSSIEIYDRYGKLIIRLRANELWDGTYNGKELPESDYWFMVTLGQGTIFQGNFSLKRTM